MEAGANDDSPARNEDSRSPASNRQAQSSTINAPSAQSGSNTNNPDATPRHRHDAAACKKADHAKSEPRHRAVAMTPSEKRDSKAGRESLP